MFVLKGETTWKRGEPQPNGCRDTWAAVLFVAQLLVMIGTALTIGIRAVKEFRDVESAEAVTDGASAADADFLEVVKCELLVGTICVALSEMHAFAPFSRCLLTLSHHRTSPLPILCVTPPSVMAAPPQPSIPHEKWRRRLFDAATRSLRRHRRDAISAWGTNPPHCRRHNVKGVAPPKARRLPPPSLPRRHRQDAATKGLETPPPQDAVRCCRRHRRHAPRDAVAA